MFGIIAGTGILNEVFFENKSFLEISIKTDYGIAKILKNKNFILLKRHGISENISPHMINHHANIMALKKAGADLIVSLSSVGSMKINLKPGSIVIPNDYINPWKILTFFNDVKKHITPGFSENLRREIMAASRKLGIEIEKKGVYIQTIGPRLETKSEINMFKDYADIIGMTVASEATLAKELGLEYASICQVDNYAHGFLNDEVIDFKRVIKNAEKTRGRVIRLVKEVVSE